MKPKIIYIAGFRQHAGKTTTSLGMIHSLSRIFDPDDIGSSRNSVCPISTYAMFLLFKLLPASRNSI